VNIDNAVFRSRAIFQHATSQSVAQSRQAATRSVEAGGDKLLSVQLLTMATTGFPRNWSYSNNEHDLDYAPGSPVQTTSREI